VNLLGECNRSKVFYPMNDSAHASRRRRRAEQRRCGQCPDVNECRSRRCRIPSTTGDLGEEMTIGTRATCVGGNGLSERPK